MRTLGVAAAHVADQGAVTAFTSPDWIGSAGLRMEQHGLQPQPPDHLIVGTTEHSFGAAQTATAIK